MTKILILLILLLSAVSTSAQTILADRIRFPTGPCVITTTVSPVEVILSDACAGITTAVSNLTLNPAGDLITNPTGNDILPDLNYDINIGMLSKKYLTLHAAELWVETLVAQNTIATIGGRVLVAPTNTLTVDLLPVSTTISVKYNNLNNGDRVYLESDGKVEFMAVASGPSGTGPYTYSVTRDLDSSGANQWYAGDAVLNTGTVGNGFIDLYSLSGVLSTGAGPTIVGNVRTGTTYNAYAPRWAIGNLNGLYGYGITTYGAAFGDAGATNVTVDAINGFRIRNGMSNLLQADTLGNLSMTGNLTVGTNGVIRSGATDFTSGNGWIMEYNGGTPRFRVGNPAGNNFTFDGTNLSVTGSITATSGVIGGWTIGATTLTGTNITLNSNGNITVGTGNNVIRISDDSTYRLWIGNATAGSAPFRVTVGGAVTMTNVSIASGSVTINSSGITVNSGLSGDDGYKFNGSANQGMFFNSNVLYWKTPTSFEWVRNGSSSMSLNGTALTPLEAQALGGTSARWSALYVGSTGINSTGDISTTSNLTTTDDLIVERNFYLDGDIIWNEPTTTTSDDYPIVYSTGTNIVYRKTDGFNGTCNSPTSIIIERGIVTGCS